MSSQRRFGEEPIAANGNWIVIGSRRSWLLRHGASRRVDEAAERSAPGGQPHEAEPGENPRNPAALGSQRSPKYRGLQAERF
jgi:hypothetical protein